MKSINPYLNFEGNTEEAFNFYKSAFGGEFVVIMRFKDAPPSPTPVPAEFGDKIMHISLPLSNGQILMGTDAIGDCGQAGYKFSAGNNFSLSIAASSEEEGQELFNKLSDDGQIKVPYAKQFWGDIFGQFTDKFGIQWQVSYHEGN